MMSFDTSTLYFDFFTITMEEEIEIDLIITYRGGDEICNSTIYLSDIYNIEEKQLVNKSFGQPSKIRSMILMIKVCISLDAWREMKFLFLSQAHVDAKKQSTSKILVS